MDWVGSGDDAGDFTLTDDNTSMFFIKRNVRRLSAPASSMPSLEDITKHIDISWHAYTLIVSQWANYDPSHSLVRTDWFRNEEPLPSIKRCNSAPALDQDFAEGDPYRIKAQSFEEYDDNQEYIPSSSHGNFWECGMY